MRRRSLPLYRRYRYQQTGRRPVGGIRRLLLLCLVLFAAAMLYAEIRLPAIRSEMQAAAVRSYGQACIAETVPSFLSQNTAISDGELVTLDTYTLSTLQSELTYALQQKVSGKTVLWVPLGNLTGLTLLNGHGLKIPVTFSIEGAADVRLTSSLLGAGINRTQYSVRLMISLELYCSSVAYPDTITVSAEYPLYEAVQQGEVPQFYSGLYAK